MNRLFKIILFITLAVGLFFSCSNEDNSQSQVMILALNNSNANASKTVAETQVSGKAYVSVSLDAKSRTIMPDLPDFVNDDSFSFTLSQKTSSFGERTIKTWETTETQSAYTQMTTEKEIAVDYAENGCDFYLSAYNGSVTYKSSVHVNKISSGEKISLVFPEFYLQVTNKGNLKVKLYFPKDAGVSTVKAELYYSRKSYYHGTYVTEKFNLDPVELEIITENTESYVIYEKNNLEGEDVYVQSYLYDQAGNFLNSFRESVILAGDCYAERHIQDVNKIHQIIFDKTMFNYREVECNDSIYFSEYETVVLETPKCGNFDFAGWYDNPDFTGEAITGWNPEEKTENIKLYPKFIAPDLYYALSVLKESGTYTIISDDTDKWGKLSDNSKNYLLERLSNNSIFVELIIRKIPKYTFKGLKCLKSVKIPSGVTEIGYELFSHCTGFSDCTGLTSVELPESLTSIGKSAFSGCTGLTSIDLPEGVTSIGDYAFRGCSGLSSIELPEGLTSIGYRAFEGCTGLTSIEIPEGVTSIRAGVFYDCTGLTSIEIPKSVTSIEDYAFFGCSGLTTLVIPESVTYLGYKALMGCKNLRKLTIPGHIEYGKESSIDYYIPSPLSSTLASYNFEELELIITGNEIKQNGEGYHYIDGIKEYYSGGLCEGLVGLRSVIISDSVTSIGGCAFSGCTGLTDIELPEGLTSIGYWAFKGCTGLTSIEIPEGVTSIGSCAFEGCTGLTSIEMPEGVTSIRNGVFYGCTGLTSIEIPKSVTSIGYRAFYGCTGLTSIEIPESVTSIGEDAFCDCTNLTSVILKDPTGWSGGLSDDAEKNASFLERYSYDTYTKQGGSN